MVLEVTEFVEIGPIARVLSHSRFLLTLRSIEGVYRTLLLFRLDIQNRPPETDVVHSIAEQIYVMESACPHLGADLSHADIEEAETGLVAVCPWHRYDFDLKTGHSESTGLKACTYNIDIRPKRTSGTGPALNVEEASIWIECPDGGTEWRLVEFRPVSEEFADPPPSQHKPTSSGSGTSIDLITLKEDVVPAEHPPKTLIEWAVLILNTAHPQLKVERTRHAVTLLRSGKLTSLGRTSTAPPPPDTPPREDIMKFVDPGHAAKRKGRPAMLHALANIEQWAIDLAWDSIARFGPKYPSLPHQFFSDFCKVALDEAKHFSLLLSRLTALGTPYGTFPIHSALWQSATETSHSLRSRLAIVHLVHEARGLDVNPATIEKFRRQGDAESVKVLEVIHTDEITHVTAGHRWFTFLCAEEGVEPVATFRDEVKKHFVGRLKGPFNESDRDKAGLTRDFYEDLSGEMVDD